MLVNSAGRVFVGKRIDNREVNADAWQMPQGGIDEGETPVEAACRELHEEVGTTKALLLREWTPVSPASTGSRLQSSCPCRFISSRMRGSFIMSCTSII